MRRLILLLVLSLLAVLPLHAQSRPFGSVGDPVGDANDERGDNPAKPDLVWATVRAGGSTLFLEVRFEPTGFSPERTLSDFTLDVDQNPATGYRGVDSGHQDAELLGVEFLVISGYDPEATVKRYNAATDRFDDVGSAPLTVLPDGHSIAVPLRLLDHDDGYLNFKVTTSSWLRPGPATTHILDYMPDVGLAPGSTGVLPTPAAPGNLRATAVGSNRVDLAWDDNSNNEDSFEIRRRTSGGPLRTVASVGRDVTAYQDTSVDPGSTYAYRVRARNGAGVSEDSNAASAATPTAGEPTPTDLAAEALSASEILLTWQDHAPTEDGYEIEGARGGAYELLTTVPADSQSATIDGLDSGTIHRFRVRAVGGIGASAYSNEAVATTFCVPGPYNLCVNGGRFKVEADWQDFEGNAGRATVVPSDSDDSGLFWFFDPGNWEMLFKVLDGCDLNQRYWVLAAATTNVAYTLRVVDTATSTEWNAVNELGVASPAIADVAAFAGCPQAGSGSAAAPPDTGREAGFYPAAFRAPEAPPAVKVAGEPGECAPSDSRLCLNGGRFRVEVEWEDFAGNTGSARVVPLGSDNSGLLWFFGADNWEMLVKVLDGCGFNDRYWVLSAATTNVAYTLRVVDTETGTVNEYRNPLGVLAPAVTDLEAFAGCP